MGDKMVENKCNHEWHLRKLSKYLPDGTKEILGELEGCDKCGTLKVPENVKTQTIFVKEIAND